MANLLLKRIKDLATSITSFRTGDAIPVDGPSGTAKMSKDDLLRETAENAVNSGVAAGKDSFDKFRYRKYGANKKIVNFIKGSYLSKSDGSLVENSNGYYTDYVDITNDFYFCINAKTAVLTCMVAVYDANKDFLSSVGNGTDALDWNDVVVSSAYLKSQNPTAKYLRFGSFNKVGSYVYQMDSVYDSDSGFDALQKNITGNKIDATAKTTGTLGTYYPVTNGKFLGYTEGDERSSEGCQCTDYIDISGIECFNVIGKSQYDVAIMCIYDGNKNFLASFGHTTGETIEWTNKKIFVDELKLEFQLFKYARFSTINTPLIVQTFTPSSLDEVYSELKNGLKEQSNSVYGSYTSSGITILETHGFINKNTGVFTEYSAAVATDYVDISTYRGKILAITGEANFDTCLIALYDSSQNFIDSFGKTDLRVAVVWTAEKVVIDDLLETYPTLKYLRFSGLNTSSSKKLNISIFSPFNTDDLVDDVLKSNSLYGKKWVACGDSFTHGGNVAIDPVTGLHKSYPYWIAQRNKMNLVMMANSGETIHNKDDSTNKFTPTRYLSIPSDADIITLSWGLNETGVTIGESSSSDDTTLWGAFNEVISFILANNPKCKIGIIIQDGWMTQTIADAEKAIGEYWGIPVLDLKFDKNVPLGIYGRPNVSTDAINDRNSVFMDATNHPTEDGHKYRSTFIESWLRSL